MENENKKTELNVDELQDVAGGEHGHGGGVNKDGTVVCHRCYNEQNKGRADRGRGASESGLCLWCEAGAPLCYCGRAAHAHEHYPPNEHFPNGTCVHCNPQRKGY